MQEFKWQGYLLRKATQAVLLLLLLLVACSVDAQTIPFSDSATKFVSKSRPEEVLKEVRISALRFSKFDGNRINFGFVGSEYHYIFLKLTSHHSDIEKYISIDNTSLDTVLIFAVGTDGAARMIYHGGQLIPFERSRKYVWHEAPVTISDNPSYYLIALKAAQKNINVRYEILSSENLEQKYQDHDRIIFFYIGVVCLIITIIILALFVFRKPVFAAYMGYILFTFAWIISHYGYIFPYVFPRAPFLNEIAKPISSLGATFFLLNVVDLVFRKQLLLSPKLQRLINVTLFILPLIIASMFLFLIPGLHYFVKEILLIAWHVGLFFTIAIIVFIPIGFLKSGATAKIFSLAMFVICTMSIIQLFANSGYINNFFVEEHGI
ncbi:MAG: 7TM diverse intracellular signaling domain-containing protein, partial [Ginsengibacter sp.]